MNRKKMLNNIPDTLQNSEDKEEDVSIIIGENGCGKSTLLGHLAKVHCEKGKEVVGIANSIHDKFHLRNRNFYGLRNRRGRKQIRETIKNALVTISQKGSDQGLKNASRALEYVHFDPKIGFSIQGFSSDFESLLLDTEEISNDNKQALIAVLSNLTSRNKIEKITWFDIDSTYVKNVESYSYTILFPFEALLRKLKIIRRLDIYLSKDKKSIPLFHASSGELTLITSIVFLSTIIKEKNTVILIDEPENSLHPKWQKEYVKILLDLFHYYQPKIIIATHSPMIVNGAEIFMKNASVYKADNFQFELQCKEAKNIEEIFYSLFEITTPENRFLSGLLVTYLNELNANKIDIYAFRSIIDKIRKSIYDEKQHTVVDKVVEIANGINQKR